MSANENIPTPTPDAIARLLKTVFRAQHILGIQLLAGSLTNFNYKVDFVAGEAVVLRVYGDDSTACLKEVALLELLRHMIPVPEVLEVYTDGLGVVGAFLITRYVEGIPFRQLKKSGNTGAIAQAAAAIGETLAAFSRQQFTRRGKLGAGLAVTEPFLNGPLAIPEFIETRLASPALCRRLDERTRERVCELAWSKAQELARLQDESCLVHGDFGSRNILVRKERGQWLVAAVIDWEFAVSGSPLFDLAHFLRYERAGNPLREPHFSRGYERGGGWLPDDWRQLARLVDLPALCQTLTETALPAAVVTEVADLVRATAAQNGR